VGEPNALNPVEDFELIVASRHFEGESSEMTFTIKTGSQLQNPRSTLSMHWSQTKVALTVKVAVAFSSALRGTIAGMSWLTCASRILMFFSDSLSG
jgi:hypothetical protein